MSPEAPRPHLLDVVGRVDGRKLEFTWSYSRRPAPADHGRAARRGDPGRAARDHAARARIRGGRPHALGLPAGRPGPGDRRPAGGDGRDVADIYPLTPTQSGLVFHGLAQRGQGLYVEQATFILDGVRDSRLLAAAWQHVVDRTPVLRSEVVLQEVPEPVQLVRRGAACPVEALDWSALTEDERRTALERLLDRGPRPRVSTSPRRRCCALTLVRLSPTEVRVVWTFHHVLLDGWSVFQVLTDVFACHAALARGTAPAAGPQAVRATTSPGSPRTTRPAGRGALAPDAGGVHRAHSRCPTTAADARAPPPVPAPGSSQRLGEQEHRSPGGLRPAPPAHPQYGRPGGLGPAAVSLERTARRVLRHDGLRPAGGPARRRQHHRPVHQHPAGAVRRGRRARPRPTGCAGSSPTQANARGFDHVPLCPAPAAGAKCRAGRPLSRAWWSSRTTRSTSYRGRRTRPERP